MCHQANRARENGTTDQDTSKRDHDAERPGERHLERGVCKHTFLYMSIHKGILYCIV